MRQQLIEKIQRLVAEDNRAPAVVELDEYFDGNTQEDSIAPNRDVRCTRSAGIDAHWSGLLK
jgi:hypothetical protein